MSSGILATTWPVRCRSWGGLGDIFRRGGLTMALTEQDYSGVQTNTTAPASVNAGEKTGRRLPSLDLLRGLIVLGMIIVNATAAFETVMPNVFPVLLHAKWAGFTAADVVFPAFITIVGISIAISTKPGQRAGTSLRKILWRSGRLIL